MTDHLADVRRYDATADAEVVGKIVRHLGIALRSRDASTVSCSDEKEVARVAERWCGKRLGILDRRRCDLVLDMVCRTMAADRHKSRVTFYYLVAKHLGKLGEL